MQTSCRSQSARATLTAVLLLLLLLLAKRSNHPGGGNIPAPFLWRWMEAEGREDTGLSERFEKIQRQRKSLLTKKLNIFAATKPPPPWSTCGVYGVRIWKMKISKSTFFCQILKVENFEIEKDAAWLEDYR
jgi:hypothetical protein